MNFTTRSLIAALLLCALPVAAQEARCTELGANCLCSLPFNNNDIPTATNKTFQVFSDNYDANGGECLFLDASGGWVLQTVNAFDTPAGFSGKVLSYYNAQAAGLLHTPFNWKSDICSSVPAAKRVCVRMYRRYDAAATHPYSDSGAPGNEIKFLESNSFQGNTDVDGNTLFRMVDATCDEATYFGGIAVNEAKTEWLRWEACFEAPSGNLCDTGGAIDLYVRVNFVDTATEVTQSVTGCTDDPITGGTYIDKIMYNGWDNTNTAANQRTYLSHYMVAAWTTTGQWIGPAEEIEGAGEELPSTVQNFRFLSWLLPLVLGGLIATGTLYAVWSGKRKAS